MAKKIRAKRAQQRVGRFLEHADFNNPDVRNLLRGMARIQWELDREAERNGTTNQER